MEDLVKKILVVDDLEDNREVLVRRLLREGCEVSVACSGREALARIQAEKPEVVLLDIMMPGVDGFEVIKRVRADKEADQPIIIAVSARHDTEAVTQALKTGANDYVAKPYDFAVVWARVERQLQQSRSARLVRDVNTRLIDRLHKMRRDKEASPEKQAHG